MTVKFFHIKRTADRKVTFAYHIQEDAIVVTRWDEKTDTFTVVETLAKGETTGERQAARKQAERRIDEIVLNYNVTR